MNKPWLLVLCLLMAGCGEGERKLVKTAEGGSKPAGADDGAPEVSLNDAAASSIKPEQDDNLTLQVLNWEETQKLVAGHMGKVVVVDLWSSDCLPCLQEFPHFVEFQNKHKGEVVCLSVNFNYVGYQSETPESHREQVLEFLTRHQANFQHVISSVPSEEIYMQLDLGSVPATYVYDRNGQLKKRFDSGQKEYGKEGFTYQKHVTPFVERLLAND